MKKSLILTVIISLASTFLVQAGDDGSSPIDELRKAQERLLYAKGNYKTIKMQEQAIGNMRKATRLSLKASKLRAKAEKLQHKADVLVNKANLAALSRGLYITNPLAPVMTQEPPEVAVQPATSPVMPPVPGEPISVSIPKEPQEEVSYEQQESNNNEEGYLNSPPTLNNF